MSGESHILRKLTQSQQRCPVQVHIQTHWKLIGCSLCHRPAIFFRHIRLIALLLPQGEIRRALQKCFLVFYYF
jgi:hypothetical protein